MSIVEVAKLAGVTHGTVSRIINGRGRVSEATVQKVRAAMEELGYQPPPPERRRGRKPAIHGVRTGNVCLLLVGASKDLIRRPAISNVVAGMEATLRRNRLNMILSLARELDDLPPAILERKVDGVLVIGEATHRPASILRELPAVWVLSSRTYQRNWADHVQPDNDQIGTMALEYLAGQGHRHLAFFNDQPEHPGFVQRGLAFQAAAQACGLRPAIIVPETVCDEPGMVWGFSPVMRHPELVDRLLAASPRPTGLFLPIDEQTARLYPLLAARGIRPGHDITFVSCDNQDAWLGHLDPRPASIDLRFEFMGQRAGEQLLLRISHPEEPAGTQIFIPPQLVEPQQPS